MEGVEAIESTLASVFKSRGFRKRARSWFGISSGDLYQVVNLQKSSWGGGNYYLNLGWDPIGQGEGYRPENQCGLRIRAEQADVIPPIQWLRAGGTVTEFPGITLLAADAYNQIPTQQLVEEVAAVIAIPVAVLMDTTVSMSDLIPMLIAKPFLISRPLRDHLAKKGHEIPTTW